MKTALIFLIFTSSLYGQIVNGGGSSSGSGVGFGASPIMAIYISPSCPSTSGTGSCFQTPANTQIATGCATSATGNTITCPSGTFASTDVGKKLFGSQTVNPFLSSTATLVSSAPLTIATFSSSAVVTTTTAPGNLASASIVWGTPDDTAFAAVDTFMASTANTGDVCPKVFLSQAQYMLTAPHLFTQPAGCLAIPQIVGNAAAQGNMYLAGGFEVEGRGPGTTILWLVPDFPESGNCNNGFNSAACFAVPLEGKFSNFQIAGVSGASATGIGTNHKMINVDVGSLEYFTCTNLAMGGGVNHMGVYVSHWAQLQQVNVSQCGDIGVQVDSSAIGYFYRLVSENVSAVNSNSSNMNMLGGTITCVTCRFFGSQFSAATTDILIQAGTLKLINSDVQFVGVSGTAFGIQCITSACTVQMSGGFVKNAGASNATDINCTSACNLNISNTTFLASGTGNTWSNTSASSILYNGTGNTGWGTGAGISNTGPGMIVNTDPFMGTAMVAANAVLSANWGSGAAWSAINGENSFTGTITNGTTVGVTPTITITFPTPFIALPNVCQATQIGGTNPLGGFTQTSLSKTGVVFTFALTPIASDTEIVQVFCQ
jgi:hypothetical protein